MPQEFDMRPRWGAKTLLLFADSVLSLSSFPHMQSDCTRGEMKRSRNIRSATQGARQKVLTASTNGTQ